MNRDEVDNSAGLNQTCLDGRFDASKYLTGHSDIVALMVLEHQADAHNYITRANFLTRQAMHYQTTMNRELKEPPDHVWDSTKSRIKSAGEPLVEYLLFSGEAELTAPVRGNSGFAEEFAQRGPRDRQGRSLRDLDLTTRLFKYPCSYLIYSPSFTALPQEVKIYVLPRMQKVLVKLKARSSLIFPPLTGRPSAKFSETHSQSGQTSTGSGTGRRAHSHTAHTNV
jgi:hypothetical protein